MSGKQLIKHKEIQNVFHSGLQNLIRFNEFSMFFHFFIFFHGGIPAQHQASQERGSDCRKNGKS